MAVVSVWVNTSDATQVGTNPTTNSAANPLTVIQGDTVEVEYRTDYSTVHHGESITFSGFQNFIFGINNTSNVTLFAGSTSFKATLTNASTGAFTLTAHNDQRGGSAYFYFNVISQYTPDTTPDPFSLGADITGVALSTVQYASNFRVTGVNTSTLVTTSGTATFSVNNSTTFQTSAYVNNLDTIQVRMNSASSYLTQIYTTVTVGTVSHNWFITTLANPNSGQTIAASSLATTPIKLSDIKTFFGGLYWAGTANAPNNLLSYLKGGTYVPNININASIPTVAPITLLDFVGSGTAFYLTSLPQSKAISTSAAGTYSLQWTVATSVQGAADWTVGFGAGMWKNTEYKYSYTETGNSTGITVQTGAVTLTNPLNIYSTQNTAIILTITKPATGEHEYRGYVTMYARSLYPPYPVVTAKAFYRFNFF